MLEYAKNELKLGEKEFYDYINKIIELGERFIAHYDGSAANYKKQNELITKYRIPGIENVSEMYYQRLEEIVFHMLKYIFNSYSDIRN